MSCYWWMNLAFFLAGFWAVFALGSYFSYRRRLKALERQLLAVTDHYQKLYRGPQRWNRN